MIKDILTMEGPVDEIFMVKNATRAISNNGTPYLSLTLQDTSGTIDAKMWQIEDSDLDIAQIGRLVKVNGLVGVYKGHPQLKINDLSPVSEDSVDLSKFIPTAPVSVEAMEKRLWEFVDLIEDEELKKITTTILKDNWEAYTTYPAGVSVHHAYLGGLMFHSLSICAMAIKVADQYSFLSKDYLIAGSLLHDIGKTRELSGPKISTYTEGGNLLGHITLGADLVYEEGKKEGMDAEKLMVLTHMILAHHGEMELGSPKVPATAEAYVLHALDDLDAKMECLKTTYSTTEEGEFTGKITWMGNTSFYKPHSLKKNKK
jgi:3'-5' exoribonuclease